MSATSKRRLRVSLRPAEAIGDYAAPGWFERLPRVVGPAAVLVVLIAASAFLRSRSIGGELWYDEATSVGIASHPLGQIFGVLRQGGGAPLYYLVLHVWMSAAGTSESSVHGLSLLCGLLTVPVAMWCGWTLDGRRLGFIAAMLFAFDGYLTEYANQARPYELSALIGLVAVGAFLNAFVYRRRRYLPLFAVALLALLYTDAWSILFFAGALVALVPVWRTSEDRSGVVRDGLITFGAVGVLFLPWLPTLVHQLAHATDPYHYAPLLSATVPRDLLGADRVDVVLLVALVLGLSQLVGREWRRTREATVVWALATLVILTLVIARVLSFAIATWVSRYFGPVAAALVLIAAIGCARSGIIGLIVLVVACAFLADAKSFIAQYPSDMQDVAAELGGALHPGDAVLVAQPEQTPLAWYYLPSGLRWFTALGPDGHPSYTNWDGAQGRLEAAQPAVLARQLLARLRPGQQLLFIRPLTEGQRAWAKPYSRLVRRRAAQYAAVLASDPYLSVVGIAPHNYRGSCCIASSATLYRVH